MKLKKLVEQFVEEQEIDEDLDSIEKLTKWINNQKD